MQGFSNIVKCKNGSRISPGTKRHKKGETNPLIYNKFKRVTTKDADLRV